MSETNGPLYEYLGAIDATDVRTGACSRRVQIIINRVHRNLNNEKTMVILGDPETGTSHVESILLHPIAESDSGWNIFASETGNIGEVRQDIFFSKQKDGKTDTPQAIRVFTFLEKANEEDCSVSLCWPATIEGIDWGVVVTQADEGRPITVDESLKEIPQINASVLDKFIDALSDDNESLNSVVSSLHLDELLKTTFPENPGFESGAVFAVYDKASSSTELTTRIGELGIICSLSKSPVKKSKKLKDGESIVFSVIDESVVEVDRVITNLGTRDRAQRLGTLNVDSQTQELHFNPEIDFGNGSSDEIKKALLEQAKSAFNVPEMFDDQELTEAINDLICDLISNVEPSEHDCQFNKQLGVLLNNIKEKYNLENQVIRLGNIDISKLGSGEYFKKDGTGVARISADVKANEEQTVFKGFYLGDNLFRCSVEGARTAFEQVEGGCFLLAENCNSAFVNCNVTDSVAVKVKNAFIKGTNRDFSALGVFNRCLAINCHDAFTSNLTTSTVNVENSLAIRCNFAFWGIDNDSTELTAEYCKKPFRKFKKGRFSRETFYKRIKDAERKKRSLVIKDKTDFHSPISKNKATKLFGQAITVK